jgi:ketosteroid isomerase-like protein
MRRFSHVVALAAITGLAGCQQPAGSPVAAPKARLTEARALAIAMSPLTNWSTENAKALDAMYSPDAIGFDASTAPLVVDGAAFVAINQPFKAMNYNKVTVGTQKIQVLSDDIFVFTSDSDLVSTTGPDKPTKYRCTDVFQRQADGKFLVVNEHCSFPPKP